MGEDQRRQAQHDRSPASVAQILLVVELADIVVEVVVVVAAAEAVVAVDMRQLVAWRCTGVAVVVASQAFQLVVVDTVAVAGTVAVVAASCQVVASSCQVDASSYRAEEASFEAPSFEEVSYLVEEDPWKGRKWSWLRPTSLVERQWHSNQQVVDMPYPPLAAFLGMQLVVH